MARRSPLTLEVAAYLVIALVALLLRFGSLGNLPLNEHEAQAALPALAIASGDAAEIGAQPGYTLLTVVLFSVLPSSEFAARFFPALFGLLFVALPYFWRDVLGRRTALVLALVFALDPGLVAVSRLASGYMLVFGALALAATAWRAQRLALAGALGGLALLAAPTLYLGAFAGLVVWALFYSKLRPRQANSRPAWLAAAAVLVLGSTLFLGVPAGLGSVTAPLAAFLTGWLVPSGVSAFKVLFALLGYGLPALIFGVWGSLRAWQRADALGQACSVLAVVALALVLLYPGRQVADLLWVLLPLWVLAAQTIANYLTIPAEEPRAAWGQALLMAVLLSFLVLSLARIPGTEELPGLMLPYLYIAAGVIVLGAVATLLIALGWSGQASVHGLVWALGAFFALFLLAAATRFGSTGSHLGSELWPPGPAAGQLSRLRDTLEQLSAVKYGQPQALSVELRVESAALTWLTRNLRPTTAAAVAPLIITAADEAEPAEASAYRGQSFVLSNSPAWAHVPGSPIAWLFYRQTPQQQEHIILWAATHLFPEDALSNSSGDSR